MTHFILCHGFGFTPHFWSRLINDLGPERCTVLDLGYYTHSISPLYIPKAQRYVGIGHSLGLQKLYALSIPYSVCIGLNGFVDFLGACPKIRAHRTKELKALRYSLCQDVKATMTQFILRCGAKSILRFIDLGSAHLSRLLNDLDAFMQPCALPTHYPTHIISAKNDPIVPRSLHGASLAVSTIEMAKGRHSLGWSYSRSMFHLIQRIHHD